MQKIVTSIILVFCYMWSFEQSKLADILYDNFEYELAAELYSKEDSLNKNQLKQFAYCYYINNQFNKAIPLFERVLAYDTNNFNVVYHYGNSLKSIGRYTAAKKVLVPLLIQDSTVII